MGEPCGCRQACGTRLTPYQMAVAIAAVPDPLAVPDQVRLVAIGMAESGGYEHACHVNSDPWHSIDRGLWQINSHWWGYGTSSYDADTCAVQATIIYQKYGPTRWHTYRGPRYVAALPFAKAAVTAVAKKLPPPNTNPWGAYKGGFGGAVKAVVGDVATTAKNAVTGSDGPCVYRFNLHIASFCLDPVFGGLKVAAGGAGMLLVGLGLVAVLSRDVTAPVAAAVGRRSPAGRAYRTVARTAPTPANRQRRQAAAVRRTAPIRAEERRDEMQQARIRRAETRGAIATRRQQGKITVYDPEAERNARYRAEVRRMGAPARARTASDEPPF